MGLCSRTGLRRVKLNLFLATRIGRFKSKMPLVGPPFDHRAAFPHYLHGTPLTKPHQLRVVAPEKMSVPTYGHRVAVTSEMRTPPSPRVPAEPHLPAIQSQLLALHHHK